jgi:hypothetical protein
MEVDIISGSVFQTGAYSSFSPLQVPSWWRAIEFLSSNNDPAADKLLVPTAVATESISQSESETHAKAEQPDTYAALAPLLLDAAERVERKTEKALETASKKPEADRIPYTNALAEQQKTYAREALQPVAEVIEKVAGRKIEVEQIAERYARSIRCRAAGQRGSTLGQIVEEYGRN